MAQVCSDTLLQMYLDSDLSPVEREILDQHLIECEVCRRHLSVYKVLVWDVAHQPRELAPPELEAVSDGLMAAWEAARTEEVQQRAAARSWADLVGRTAREVPRAGLAGIRWLLRRGGGRR